MKYLPEFPESFASLADARQFCAGFFHEYNYIHRHSGIAWHTPASVHFGTADAIDQEPTEHPDRGLPRPPRAVRTPTAPTSHADPVLDQPARPRTPNELTQTVSFDLTDSVQHRRSCAFSTRTTRSTT